jgi:hypothetical protein
MLVNSSQEEGGEQGVPGSFWALVIRIVIAHVVAPVGLELVGRATAFGLAKERERRPDDALSVNRSSMDIERRREIAKKAAAARWAKRRNP